MAAIIHSIKRCLHTGVFVTALLLVNQNATAEDTLILPDDPNINYYGRFDFTNPKAPRFNWSGSTIELKISGSTSVGIELTDGAGYYDIEVDGKVQSAPVYANSYSSRKYTIVSALSTDAHVIRIVKRNEPYWVVTTFSGIYLSNGGKTLPLAKPVRKMEFMGDSFTAGYFIEECTDQQANTNTNKSWARLTSKAFNAQDIILAESGIGLVKSLGGKSSLPKKYPGTLDTVGNMSTPMWNFSNWIPDIVSIFLGINDKNSGVTDNEYTAAVHDFVKTIRGNYPSTPILFISYTGCMDEATKAAVAAETTTLGHKDVYFMECKQKINGCSWHPTVDDAQQISDSVVAKIKQITGWDNTPVSFGKTEAGKNARKSVQITTSRIDNRTMLILTDQIGAGYPIQVMTANGQVVKKMRFDLSGKCNWHTTHASEGFYFIGSRELGWTKVFVERH